MAPGVKIGAREQLVGIVHIGLVVLDVIELEGGLADIGLQDIQPIGKLRQFNGLVFLQRLEVYGSRSRACPMGSAGRHRSP